MYTHINIYPRPETERWASTAWLAAWLAWMARSRRVKIACGKEQGGQRQTEPSDQTARRGEERKMIKNKETANSSPPGREAVSYPLLLLHRLLLLLLRLLLPWSVEFDHTDVSSLQTSSSESSLSLPSFLHRCQETKLN